MFTVGSLEKRLKGRTMSSLPDSTVKGKRKKRGRERIQG